MRALYFIGQIHLQGIMVLKEHQERVFREIVKLVQEGKMEEAERAASDFFFNFDDIPSQKLWLRWNEDMVSKVLQQ